MKDKFKGALGLCMRARKCVMGSQAVSASIKKRKAKLVLICNSTAEGTMKDIVALCQRFDIEYRMGDLKDIYYDLTFKEHLKVVAVEDDSFADMIKSVGYL